MGAIINSQNVMLRGNNSFAGVTTDDTLSGNGTSASPLGVIFPESTTYYVDSNMSGSGTSAEPWGLNDSITLTNSFFGRSASYSFGTAALNSDSATAQLMPTRLLMNGYVDNNQYNGSYKADGFGSFGACTGYSSEYYPMNSNSGVKIPAMDYVSVGCDNPRGIFEVQGGPASNTNGMYGVQLFPSNVLTWTGWSRSDFSRQFVDGLQIWRLGQATGQPVAYWKFDSMRFCKYDGTSAVEFSLEDLNKLKQLINNM